MQLAELPCVHISHQQQEDATEQTLSMFLVEDGVVARRVLLHPSLYLRHPQRTTGFPLLRLISLDRQRAWQETSLHEAPGETLKRADKKHQTEPETATHGFVSQSHASGQWEQPKNTTQGRDVSSFSKWMLIHAWRETAMQDFNGWKNQGSNDNPEIYRYLFVISFCLEKWRMTISPPRSFHQKHCSTSHLPVRPLNPWGTWSDLTANSRILNQVTSQGPFWPKQSYSPPSEESDGKEKII